MAKAKMSLIERVRSQFSHLSSIFALKIYFDFECQLNFYQIFAGFRAVKVGGGRHHNCPPSSVTHIRGGDGVRFKKKIQTL